MFAFVVVVVFVLPLTGVVCMCWVLPLPSSTCVCVCLSAHVAAGVSMHVSTYMVCVPAWLRARLPDPFHGASFSFVQGDAQCLPVRG